MTTFPGQSSRFLDPAALAKLRNMSLAARLVVEGLYSGQHRSPHRGFSVEFAEHRQYTPGDEPRYLDWKLAARRDRLYVKQFEEQTNLRCYILLDASKSMTYQSAGPMSKLDYARYCAASLAYLMQTQHDAFGLIVHDDKTRLNIPPRQGHRHLAAVTEALEAVEPAGETDLPAVFHELAETLKRRALVIVLSDLFSGSAPPEALLDAFGHFRHRKHEVIVLQMLDRDELTFPFVDAGQIEDIETGRIISADAEAVKRHYLAELTRYLDAIRTGLTARQIGYALADTSQPFDTFLARYLSQRQAASRVRMT
ncbi:MAG: DUF58 domain-containing protein [Planctomycetes bacterium]|nr:DUF58 domain-containing protein [Planctomycetota bacterium]